MPKALPPHHAPHPHPHPGASSTPPERTKHDERRGDLADDKSERFDPLDPATRRAAQLAPPQLTPTVAPAAQIHPVAGHEEIAPRARVSMEELLPQLVKRIAWAGDRRRGSVQLELGAGQHAGTTITVHADDGRVRVEVDGAGANELRSRIRTRLERHGLDVASVT
ncbi:MAG: hypothetical protein K0S65_5744 [Labilithrix sp.]|nr:hypothetical protein [Labilithrix sp.]